MLLFPEQEEFNSGCWWLLQCSLCPRRYVVKGTSGEKTLRLGGEVTDDALHPVIDNGPQTLKFSLFLHETTGNEKAAK